MQRFNQTMRALGITCVMLAVGDAVFHPALSGGFLFDDFPNLKELGRYAPLDNLSALLRYLTSGFADPTGRPVAQLSFLLDANNWPADPYPFKRTNLLIHLINGSLLFAVLLQLGRRMQLDFRLTRQAALGGAALWLLHPLWVSTVAYVIQRQAMLATTFVLAGILCWIAGQRAFSDGWTTRGWMMALTSMGVCGLLAGLSKANGFLLPVLLLALQTTLLRPAPALAPHNDEAIRRATVALLIIPSCLILGYLMWRGIAGWNSSHGRPWLLYQRLLSQPRALLDYFALMAWPRVHSPGLFADDFLVSRNLWQPLTTLPALLLVLTIGICAWLVRRRAPILSAAILFFFAGHLLESTTISLELYFEHRNYLPAALLGWPIAVALLRPGNALFARRMLLIAFVITLSAVTFSRSSLWGDEQALTFSWAEHLPNSPRAQTNAANAEMDMGRYELAFQRLAPLREKNPTELQYGLRVLDAECVLGRANETSIASAATAIRANGIGKDMAHNWLRSKLEDRTYHCPVLEENLAQLIDAAHLHPQQNAMTRNRLTQLDGLLAIRTGRCKDAVHSFNAGLAHERNPAQVHGQTGVLATYCDAAYALQHLAAYRQGGLPDTPVRAGMPRVHQWLLEHQNYWHDELDGLTQILVQEIQTADNENHQSDQ